MRGVSEVEHTNSRKHTNNPCPDQTEQAKTIERSNLERNSDNRRYQGWMRHDVGSFQRKNIGSWPMRRVLASSLQQLQRTSSSANLAQKLLINISRLGNEIHPPQNGQYNNRV
ncbi:MAG: hypothetical protein EZS28_031592 [Streblomastix strix]|uniref:Uncharacterized protein n=1 Tax=Streblomastix strix TaxID=222440 RepID=A0A5J4US51_9EUKA|nr:MAG: hypothetical protein EZS28_031592 [Streblomastix strix]